MPFGLLRRSFASVGQTWLWSAARTTPVPLLQRDHARDYHQPDPAELLDTLIERAESCP